MKKTFKDLDRHAIKIDRAVFTKMLQGDERCEFKKGDRVRKTKSDPAGDITPIGVVGTIIGSLYHEALGEMYYVCFDGNPMPTAAVRSKIEKVTS